MPGIAGRRRPAYISLWAVFPKIAMKLSIIIPVYNEYANVDHVIAAVQAVRFPAGIDAKEIILVDDGSVDGTAAKVAKYRNESGFVVHQAPLNRGKGTAVRTGLTYVTGDIVIIQDADLEYDPNDYVALLLPILQGRARVVYGSRFLGRRVVPGMKPAYWLANHILRTLTNILYRAALTDEATAYKVFRTEVLRGLTLTARRFEICPELTAKVLRSGERIVEVPIHYCGRTRAEGKKIRFSDALVAAWTLVKYRVVG